MPSKSSLTVQPSPPTPVLRAVKGVDVMNDAMALHEATKGFSANEDAIIALLTCRTSEQRQQIVAQFLQSYGKELVSKMKSKLSGNLEDFVVALLTPEPLYLARELHRAMSGLGTDDGPLIEILCSRSNADILAIKKCYEVEFKKSLESTITSKTSGAFQRLLVALCAACREEDKHNYEMAANLADQLYKAGEGKKGTDDQEFNRILVTYSYPVLRKVFYCYERYAGHSFQRAIDAEFSGSIKTALTALYQIIMNRQVFFAHALYKSMAGAGTRDHTLIRLIVTRSEADLATVKEEYLTLYNKTLEEHIKGDTSGSYKKALLAIVVG